MLAINGGFTKKQFWYVFPASEVSVGVEGCVAKGDKNTIKWLPLI